MHIYNIKLFYKRFIALAHMIEIGIGSFTMSVLWKGLKPAFQYSRYCLVLDAENFLKEITGILL